jgi:hypothetical protein
VIVIVSITAKSIKIGLHKFATIGIFYINKRRGGGRERYTLA